MPHEDAGAPSEPVDITSLDDDLIDVMAGDRESTDADQQRVSAQSTALGATFFSSLIAALVGLKLAEREAEHHWEELLKHKLTMSEKLGRNVGIRVAGLDYFTNITGTISSARVVDGQTLVQTARLAITDGLTGLYNHRYFHDRLGSEIERANEADVPLSVIMLDIDYFKQYNDINGHVAGDVALHQVAQLIRNTVADAGPVARYGGEEFAIILPSVGKRRAGDLAEAIREAVRNHPLPNEFVLPGGCLTLSGGVGEFPLDGTTRRSLVDYADRALYEAKHQGRNQIRILAPNRRRTPRKRLSVAVELLLTDSQGTGERVPAQTINISTGGILCQTERGLPDGKSLNVVLPEFITGSAEPLLAIVGRCRHMAPDTWQLGLRFVRLPAAAAQALQGFVAH